MGFVVHTDRELAERIMRECGLPAFSVYFALCGFCDASGECFPSVETLADKVGRTDRTIRRQMNILEPAGFVERLKGPKGNRYRVLRTPKLDDNVTGQICPPADDDTGQKRPATADTIVRSQRTSMSPKDIPEKLHQRRDTNISCSGDSESFELTSRPKTKTKQPKRAAKPNDYSVEFMEFWQAYPRRVGKAKALQAWNKAIGQGHDPKHIIERATLFAQSPSGQQGKFTPHPTTWLNAGRFEDDTSEWNAGDKNSEWGNGPGQSGSPTRGTPGSW